MNKQTKSKNAGICAFYRIFGFRKALKWFCIKVIIHAVNIGIGMVYDVVFHLPHKSIGSKKVERQSRKCIYPGFAAKKTAMSAIVHDVEPDS